MRAMVLAAGLGTRLRPLTNDRPKALVEIAGRTLLEITLTRLKHFGIRDVVVNVHHFADKVVDYLRANDFFQMRIEISREDDLLLDTGGGLKKAAHFFLRDDHSIDEPFIIHNVDVISTIDLEDMVQVHRRAGALATLAIQQRQSSRQLLFDEKNKLCGRQTGAGPHEIFRPSNDLTPWAFCGIHVVSPRILGMISEEGVFPIVPVYLRLAAQGEKILGYDAGNSYWCDLGKPESLARATEDLLNGTFQ